MWNICKIFEKISRNFKIGLKMFGQMKLQEIFENFAWTLESLKFLKTGEKLVGLEPLKPWCNSAHVYIRKNFQIFEWH